MLEWLTKTYNRSNDLDPKVEDKVESEFEKSIEVISLNLQDSKEEIAPLPVATKRRTENRKSVSAEAYGEYNKKEDFKPRVIEKTEEQKERLSAKLMMSFMFNSLNNQEMEIVLDAIEEKNYVKDDIVIKQKDDGDELYIVDSGTLSCSRVFV